MAISPEVLLVDGFNLIRRIYEARPHDDEAVQQEVIVSACNSLTRALHRIQPSHACCIFDSQEKTWRHLLYPEYKQNRKPTPAPLLAAIPEFEKAFLDLGVVSVAVVGYEADDVIATLAQRISQVGGRVQILSTDKGFLQLLDDHIVVYDHFNNRDLTAAWVFEKYGVKHEQLVDYWALTGDSTNNVKGVPKVGPKTAQQLITEFGTLENIMQNIPATGPGERISKHLRDAEVSQQLARLKADVEVGINLNQLRYSSGGIS